MTDNEMTPDLCLLTDSESVDWAFLHSVGIEVDTEMAKDRVRTIIHEAYLKFRENEHLGKSVINAEIQFTVPDLNARVILSDMMRGGRYGKIRFEKLDVVGENLCEG